VRAGGRAAVPVDGEHVRGVATGPGLGGGAGQQRAEQGDALQPGGHQQVRGDIAGIGGVLAGSSPDASRLSCTGAVIATSGTAACVVCTLVTRFGAAGRLVSGSSSAGSLTVSVKWPLYPSQPMPCFSEYPGIKVIRGGQAVSARPETVLAFLPPDHLPPSR